MSLLVLEKIVKEYRNKCLLNEVTLRVERGERVALVGPNGSGKTTLLKIAMGLETGDRGTISRARNVKVGYLSQDLQDFGAAGARAETALHYEKVFQLEQKIRTMEKQMAELSKGADLVSAKRLMDEYARLLARYEAIDGYTIETKIKKVLLGLGLNQECLSTPVDRLSGGEKIRVLLARILLEEPDLLILDEPTNHLDITAIEWLEGFLKRFNGGILFVSHDRYFLDRVATRVAELEQGGLCVRSGSYSNYLQHKEQLREFAANAQRRLRWILRNSNNTVQGLKSRGKIKALKSREKLMTKLGDEQKANLDAVKRQNHLHAAAGPKINFKTVRHVSKDIAWAENLHKSFGKVNLFCGAAFHIRGGDRIGLIGPNGCGKSTLVNLLLGKDKQYEGFLRLGEWVNYSYMGQEVLFENEKLTVLQLITEICGMLEAEARDYLAGFQFYGDDVNKAIGVLSGGERVRLYLACVMLENADCLILDEPTNHLDMPARAAVEAALKEFRGTIITVTHDRYYLTNCVSKILEIEHGKINTYEGNYEFYKQVKLGNEQNAEKKVSRSGEVPAKKVGKKPNAGAAREKPEREKQAIEAQIISLEARLKEMESLFDQATPAEKYQEYGRLLEEVEKLYSEWFA